MIATEIIKTKIASVLGIKEPKDSDCLLLWADVKDIEEQVRRTGKNAQQIWIDEFTKTKYPNLNEIIDLHKILCKISLTDFLRFVTPDMVREVEKSVSLIERIEGNYNRKIEQLFKVKLAIYRVQKRNIPLKQIATRRNEIYQDDYCKRLPDDFEPLDKETFWELYKAIGGYTLSEESRNLGFSAKETKEIYAPVKSWIRSGESAESMVSAMAAYYGKGTGKKGFLAKNEAQRKALTQMAKVSLIDFLCAVDYSEEDNLPLELSYVFEENLRKLSFDTQLLLVMPSMAFLRKWLEQEMLSVIPVTVVVADEDRQYLLQLQCGDARYSGYKRPYIEFVPFQKWLDEKSRGKEYTNALLFTENLDGNIKETLACVTACCEKTLIWTTETEFRGNPLYRDVASGGSGCYSRVETLPIGVRHSKNGKKVLATYQRTGGIGCIEIIQYGLNKNAWKEPVLFRYFDTTPVLITQEDFWTETGTVRQIRRKLLKQAGPEKEKRKGPSAYPFLPEIPVWYTVAEVGMNKVDVKAYIASRNKRTERALKGTLYENSVRYKRNLDASRVEDWLQNEYPFLPGRRGHADELGVRETIGQYVRDAYAGKPVSLRTLWYAYPEDETEFSKRRYIDLTNLVWEPVGEVEVTKDIATTLWEGLGNFSEEERAEMWELLVDFLIFGATKTDHYPMLDATALRKDLQRGKSVVADIRAGLVKKTFTDKQNRVLEELINEEMKKDDTGRALGAKIRMRTGLESKIICALQRQDLFETESGIWCLEIRRQIRNGEAVPLDSETAYRDIPCTDELTALLCKEQPEKGERFLVGEISPSALDAYCKGLLSKLGIGDDKISVPDARRGSVKTNLAIYRGDLFRENFRYLAAEKMGMTTGEIAYLLGVQASVTHERHYCDYSNEFVLLQMQRKLQRWENQLYSSTTGMAKFTNNGMTIFNKDSSVPEAIELEFSVGEEPIEIQFKSGHGVNVEVMYYGEEV